MELEPDTRACPVKVHLDNGQVLFYGTDEIFFHELDIPESARTRPEPPPKHDFKPGDPVIVWDSGSKKYAGCFVRYQEYANHTVFIAQTLRKEMGFYHCVPYDRALLGFETDHRDLPEGTEVLVKNLFGKWVPVTLVAVLNDGSAVVWYQTQFTDVQRFLPKDWRLPNGDEL